jgi:hypothetical protein
MAGTSPAMTEKERHCEERCDEAIHTLLGVWIASLRSQ